MKWITPENMKVDRVATPFDIEGRQRGHHGEDVSFNSLR
jgi:hypothetical protein